MTREFRNERDLALHAVKNDGVHTVHVVGHERHQGLQRRCPRDTEFEDGRGHGAALAAEIRLS